MSIHRCKFIAILTQLNRGYFLPSQLRLKVTRDGGSYMRFWPVSSVLNLTTTQSKQFPDPRTQHNKSNPPQSRVLERLVEVVFELSRGTLRVAAHWLWSFRITLRQSECHKR